MASRAVAFTVLAAALLLAPLAQAQSLRALPAAAICFIDGDGGGTYGPGEAVLFSRAACGATRANDVRLSGPAFATKVRVGDADFNAPSSPPAALPAAAMAFYDADGSGAWNPGDGAYLKLTGGTAVALGDVRLTARGPLAPGSFVRSGDADLGLPAQAVARSAPGADWKFFDADGDGAFGGNDSLYIDTDGNGEPTVADIAIAPAPPPTSLPPNGTPPGPAGDDATSAQLAALLAQSLELQARVGEQLNASRAMQAQLGNLTAQVSQRGLEVRTLASQVTDLRDENAALRAQLDEPAAARTPGLEGAALLAALAFSAWRRRP